MSRAGTVYLVEHEARARRGLARLLSAVGYEVRAFASALEFLDRGVPRERPACLVLDLRMPGISGLELQGELRQGQVPIPVVFLTRRGDVASSAHRMRDGAVDVVLEPVQDGQLLGAIRAAHQRHLRDTEFEREVAGLRRRFETLTPREREVMGWVVRGTLNKQIAARLGTVEKTIKVHRGRVMEKMGVPSLADLVRAAERLELPLPDRR